MVGCFLSTIFHSRDIKQFSVRVCLVCVSLLCADSDFSLSVYVHQVKKRSHASQHSTTLSVSVHSDLVAETTCLFCICIWSCKCVKLDQVITTQEMSLHYHTVPPVQSCNMNRSKTLHSKRNRKKRLDERGVELVGMFYEGWQSCAAFCPPHTHTHLHLRMTQLN